MIKQRYAAKLSSKQGSVAFLWEITVTCAGIFKQTWRCGFKSCPTDSSTNEAMRLTLSNIQQNLWTYMNLTNDFLEHEQNISQKYRSGIFHSQKYQETIPQNTTNLSTFIHFPLFIQGTDGPKPATTTAGLSRTGSGGPAKARRKASETSDWLKPFWKRKSSLSLVGWSLLKLEEGDKMDIYLSENLGKW